MKCGISGRVGAFILLVSGPATVVRAQTPYLVKDINLAGAGSSPSGLANVNGTLFFAASDPTNGEELWKSDGTAAGTVLVKDINPGGPSSSPTWLTNVNGTLFFAANDGANGVELWKSDGTPAGTVLVNDINSGSPASAPRGLINVNGVLFFIATFTDFEDATRVGLGKSDGSGPGTYVIDSVDPELGALGNLTNVNGTLFFSKQDEGGNSLRKTDGTNLVVVKSMAAANLANVNGTLFFAGSGANGTELWKSDGTPAGTVLVKDINPGVGSSNPTNLANVNGTLFFSANNGTNGVELWKSDGTAAGTVLVKDIAPGSGSSFFQSFINVNGTLFFVTSDATNGQEVWKSDGTAAGTVPVKDINPGSGGSIPTSLTAVNSTLFFSANDGTSGSELWKTDGTLAGTVRVKDTNPGSASADPTSFANVNGTLFLGADDGAHGRELWKSDGTTAGTVLVKDINLGSVASSLANLTDVNGTLFFLANNGTSGAELWKSDGTAAGTVLVKDINPGSASSGPASLVNLNGTLFFYADDGTHGRELWKSDGTSAGTAMVKDINPGTATSDSANPSVTDLTNVNGTLFFYADDGTHGRELWKSDGTASGTVLVKDVNPGIASSDSAFGSDLTKVNATLFFVATDGAPATELWKSDGTATGTVLVASFFSGVLVGNLANVNGTLFFAAPGGAAGTVQLWKSDGTLGGTALVRNQLLPPVPLDPSGLTNVNGTLFFTATDAAHGVELWKSDGTSAGTSLVRDISLGAASSDPTDLINVNGTLLFSAKGPGGTELWKSDGTTAGTVLVKDIRPGSASSNPMSLANFNGTLLFNANDGTSGFELWKSDGTAVGTVLVQDIRSGAPDSLPSGLTVSGPRLFFSADDGATGQELWALLPTSADLSVTLTDGQTTAVPGTPVSYTISVTNAGPDAASVTVVDNFPPALTGVTWACNDFDGASCGATSSGTGNMSLAVGLPVGGYVVITATGTVSPNASGTLANTASLAGQSNSDPSPANNSATDTDVLTPQAELSITKSDGRTTAAPGQVLVYTIVASNAGPSGATGAIVTDGVPAALTGVTWTCTGSGSGTCTASGSGSISDVVNLPVGATVTYTLSGTLSPSATGPLSNTASVTAPGGVVDTNLANNSATDTDLLPGCGAEIVIVPDGRLTRSLIAAGTTAWFGASLRIGNSYALEFQGSTAAVAPGTLTVYSGDDGCSGTSTLVTTNTADVDPPGAGGTARVSFIATGTAGYFRAKLVNGLGTSIPFAFAWSDTTMFSPAWSDNGAFDTFYSFQNTTGSGLTGKLTLFDVNGAVLTTVSLTIPAGQTVSTNTGAVGIARNLTGTARFTHNGPPGAVVAEAAIARFSISPAYVQPVKFQAMREAR